MPAAPRAQPTDFFSVDEWRTLSARSPWRGLWLVAHCWGVIGLAMLLAARWPLLIPLAVLVIGTRQLGLFILMHDAAHALLHNNRRINDWVGHWLCSTGLRAYRPYHLQHHRFVQQTEDPDLVLSAPFPVTRASFGRKVLRDLSGQTWLKQHFGALLDGIRRRPAGTPPWRPLLQGLADKRRFLLANVLAFGLFAAAGQAWVWLVLWLLPAMTWLQLVYRVRNIAEHALVAQNQPDPLRQARTTHANWLERALVAPYWVNYHGEHHLFTQLPCWQLPLAHRLLQRGGVTTRMELQPGYLAVLRLATAG